MPLKALLLKKNFKGPTFPSMVFWRQKTLFNSFSIEEIIFFSTEDSSVHKISICSHIDKFLQIYPLYRNFLRGCPRENSTYETFLWIPFNKFLINPRFLDRRSLRKRFENDLNRRSFEDHLHREERFKVVSPVVTPEGLFLYS